MVKGGCPKDRVLFDPAGLFLFKERRKADSRCSGPWFCFEIKAGYEADGGWNQNLTIFFVKRTMSAAVKGIMEYMKQKDIGQNHILYIVHAAAKKEAEEYPYYV